MLKNYKDGASTWQKIVMTYKDFNKFTFSKESVGDIKFDKWMIGFLATFSILPIILFSGLFTSFNPEIERTKMTATGSSKLANNYKEKNIQQIGNVKAGDELDVLCYMQGDGLFLVETEEGERGWVSYKAFGNEVAVRKLDKEYPDLKLGDILKVSTANTIELSATDTNGKRYKLSWSNVIPTSALGIKYFKYADSFSHNALKVTTKWVEEHFKTGTKLEDISDSFYGAALSIDILDDGSKVITYPYWVKDFKRGDEYRSFSVTYQNDEVVSYSYGDEHSMDLVEEYLPMGASIASSSLVTRLRSSFFIKDNQFDDLEDVIEDGDKNDNKKLTGIVSLIVSGVMLIIVVGGLFFVMTATLMILPAIVQLLGYVKPLPNFIYRMFIYSAVVISVLGVFIAFCPHWIFGIILFFLCFMHIRRWGSWINYNRCPECKTMYSLETVGYSDTQRSYYDNVKYEVNQRTGDKREVGREHRVVISYTEYLHCVNCDNDFNLAHSEDQSA